jgi:hypothetical protein
MNFAAPEILFSAVACGAPQPQFQRKFFRARETLDVPGKRH